jgi:hypothetical protein
MVSSGLRGDVGVVPRQFLRELVTVFDLVEEHDGSDGGEEYIPREVYRFPTGGMSDEEHALMTGSPGTDEDDTPTDGYKIEELEW